MPRANLLRQGVLVLLILAVLAASTAAGGTKSESLPPPVERTVDFKAEIWPLLEKHCFKCHGPQTQKARLRLDAKKVVLGGGRSGPAIVPGKSAESLLVQRIAGLGSKPQMPRDGEPLSKKQIGLIRAWIDQGASWPDSIGADVKKVEKHWAYVKPERPEVPNVKETSWIRNPIDAFIRKRLNENDLSPSPEASKEQLIRRVSLDLIGLPPTPEQIDRFLADDSPHAYEKLVDRLLASPRYGERWAIPWLDAARYADSNGYQRDGRRENWAYRDWVIRALNADMPFDEFTVKQIAGDLLPQSTFQDKVATGFHRNTMANVEAGTDPEEERVLAIIDRINTTGTVWLGTTIECAQCHDHKYDPVTQKEYYRLFAFFNSTEGEIGQYGNRVEFEGPKTPLPLSVETKRRRDQLQAEHKQLKSIRGKLREKLKAEQPQWEKRIAAAIEQKDKKTLESIPKDVRKIVTTPKKERDKKQRKRLAAFHRSQSPQWKQLEKQRKNVQAEYKKTDPPTTLVMKELPEPRETHMFIRGDFLNKGQKVEPGTPKVLHSLPETDSRPNRLTLAQWLVDEDNPLTARVIMNRQWAEFFGRGIVKTLEDFGTQGARPTHPQLLDWLATEFVRRDWSLKAMQRLIVTSATYRQSSKVTPRLLQRDPQNKFYARMSRRRLKAELIRDNALAIAGLLSDNMHGPPVFPYQPPGVWNHIGRASNKWTTSSGENLYRRGVYVYWRRTVPYPSFVNFDAPSREACTVQRPVSNTPLQALTLMNDPAFFEAAAALAGRLLTEPEAGSTVADRADYGFRLCTGQHAKPAELDVLTSRYRSELERYRNSTQAAKKVTRKWRKYKPDEVSLPEFAAWIHVGNVLLNLDATITKG